MERTLRSPNCSALSSLMRPCILYSFLTIAIYQLQSSIYRFGRLTILEMKEQFTKLTVQSTPGTTNAIDTLDLPSKSSAAITIAL